MKVSELISQLQRRDQNEEVLVNVRTQTTCYGQAQCEPWQISSGYGATVIDITLPGGMFIGNRKKG